MKKLVDAGVISNGEFIFVKEIGIIEILKNDALILKELAKKRHTRTELADKLCIPRTSAWDALDRLEILGLVGKLKEKRTTKGRPKTIFYSKK